MKLNFLQGSLQIEQFRKYTKTKSVYSTDMSLMKFLYLATKSELTLTGPGNLYYQNYLLCLMAEFSL